MAENDDLESFLTRGEAEKPVEAVPDPVATPEPEAKTEEPAVEPEEKPATEGERQVPVAALQAERRERQDWKEKALRMEGEMTALKAQMEAAKAAPAAPPAAPATLPVPRMPNPVEDPEGFMRAQQQHIELALFNDRLNNSEAALRRQHGNEIVDKKLDVFKTAAEKNPALKAELMRQVDPYQFVFEQAQRIEAMQEIGTDPTAYRAKVEAELRAKWEAEHTAAPEPVAAAPLPFQSLAGARNAGPRSGAQFTGPTPLDQLFPQR